MKNIVHKKKCTQNNDLPALTTPCAYFVIIITLIKLKLIDYLNYLKNITRAIKCIVYCINM